MHHVEQLKISRDQMRTRLTMGSRKNAEDSKLKAEIDAN